MEIYLVQHGLAKSVEEDPDRSLTETGIGQTRRMVPFLAQVGEIRHFWHSGKTRARQTAEILAGAMDPKPEILEKEGLNPNSDPGFTKKQIEGADQNLLIVGHLPHLEKLVSLLLVGDDSRHPVEFKNSGVLCLSDKPGEWAVQWYVLPGFLSGE